MRFRRLALAALIAASTASDAAPATEDLYSATVIVTGRDNLSERERGIAEAVAAVLVRVSADPEVGRRFEARASRPDAADFVVDLDYVDRKEGIQISDEQGARDRSFELTVAFEPKAIDALLADLNAAPWPAPRSVLPVDLTVRTQAKSYRLTVAGDDGYAQRLSLLDAADDLGLAVELPSDDVAAGGPASLTGEMRITEDGLWDSDWSVRSGSATSVHAVRAKSFDATFEDALAFAASVLKRSR